MKSFALVASAMVAAPLVAADFVPSGAAAHFFSTQNSVLVFAPEGSFPNANLVAATPGDGSFNDITALFPTFGTGEPGQLAWGDWCVTAQGVVPGSSFQTLYITDCAGDPKQIWTVNEDSQTVSNADGNCITLGKAAKGAPVTLAPCREELLHLQQWDPKPTYSL